MLPQPPAGIADYDGYEKAVDSKITPQHRTIRGQLCGVRDREKGFVILLERQELLRNLFNQQWVEYFEVIPTPSKRKF